MSHRVCQIAIVLKPFLDDFHFEIQPLLGVILHHKNVICRKVFLVGKYLKINESLS